MNLAFRLRPETLDDFLGQEHLIGKGKVLNQMISSGNLLSIIFWGPPGCGKTTLAYIIAKSFEAHFCQFSAVTSGKQDLLKIIERARALCHSESASWRIEESSNLRNVEDPFRVRLQGEPSTPASLSNVTGTFDVPSDAVGQDDKRGKKTILFIDEIHRWNKAQQDALLPHVENGLITLIGATTENPSFEVISPLLSRCRVFVLKSLCETHLEKLLDRALKDTKKGVGKYKKKIKKDARKLLLALSGGDARIMLNALEIAVTSYKQKLIDKEIITEIFQTRSGGLYDKAGDEHYNTISAYIKSMRAGDADAALYYLTRMIEAGEDPLFIARRMVIFASEDIGMALPTALVVANEVFQACHAIGYPECAINLAHGTVYLAKAPKDRSSYDALRAAQADVINYPNLPIPLNLRNAPTSLMKDLGYGKDYQMYPEKDKSLLPEKLKGKRYYRG